MLIRVPPLHGLHDRDATPQALFSRRRLALAGLAAGLVAETQRVWAQAAGPCNEISPPVALADKPTEAPDFLGYNNYFEFSTDKKAVRHLAQELDTSNWLLTIEGEVEKPLVLDMDRLRQGLSTSERIYRLRCVEGWSMVVPWSGIPLCSLLALVRPTSKAKFVEFVSLSRPSQMIGQRSKASAIQWPYREGLRIDEAMHPLTLLATGAYGQPLAKQNGAPVRLVVPWKYGFKSAKAITHIRLRDARPETSWNRLSPSEYGFYGNVNPTVPHPRWSQARENPIGEVRKRPTLAFNGYAEQVAHLYSGQDPLTLY